MKFRANRVKMNHTEARRVLRGEGAYAGVLDDLEDRANRVAEAAGPGFEADVYVGPERARGGVITATVDAQIEEARNHTLLRAIDAARD
jgi:hypothetical protein